MIKFFLLISVFLLATCQEDLSLPEGPAPTSGTRKEKEKPHSTLSNDPKDIHFYYYSDPSNPNLYHEIIIDDVATLSKLSKQKTKMIFLLEGFLNLGPGMNLVKDAYLQRGETDIILLDYANLMGSKFPPPISFVTYFEALKNIQVIGSRVADFIQFLLKNGIITGSQSVHLVGISLGAHISGTAGRLLQKRYSATVGRITGLDPAGPFTQALKNNKLSSKYASFVDAIHTDIDVFGTPKSLGHADFFVNGGVGRKIPGCEKTDPATNILCAHGSSINFYRNTVGGSVYKGCECRNKTVANIPICGKPTTCKKATIVGVDAPNTARGNFFVEVKDQIGALPSYATKAKEFFSDFMATIKKGRSRLTTAAPAISKI